MDWWIGRILVILSVGKITNDFLLGRVIAIFRCCFVFVEFFHMGLLVHHVLKEATYD